MARSILLHCILLGLAAPFAAGSATPRLVKDLSVSLGQNQWSTPTWPTTLGNQVVFSANSDSDGTELYVTDGTSTGAHVLKDINPGPDSSTPYQLVTAGSLLFFVADDGLSGQELWKTDGTPAGTVRVKDVAPGPQSSSPSWLSAVGSKVYFLADDGVHGREVWVSDGTEPGTFMLADIDSGSGSVLASSGGPWSAVGAGALVYFPAFDGAQTELWETDGTTTGTQRVTDLNGTSSSYPHSLVAFGGKLYFGANDTAGPGLYVTDGTSTGTALVSSVEVDGMVDVGGTLMFESGRSIWKSDGTGGGTSQVVSLLNSVANPVGRVTTAGGLFYGLFSQSLNSLSLWACSPAGVNEDVLDLASGDGAPYSVELGGRLVLATVNPAVFISDGTRAGTTRLTPFASSPINGIAKLGTHVLFPFNDPTAGTELWSTDGSAAGTALLQDVTGVSTSSWAYNVRPGITGQDGLAYFFARSPNLEDLWRSDGTSDGTTRVVSDAPLWLDPPIAFGSSVFFDSRYSAPYLTRIDGDGTVTPLLSNPTAYQLTVFNGRMYFGGPGDSAGIQLWSSDGTAPGTVLLTTISGSSPGIFDQSFVAVNGALFFVVGFNGSPNQLWKTDGTAAGTLPVWTLPSGWDYWEMAAGPGKLLLDAVQCCASNNPVDLWSTDGTSPGVLLATFDGSTYLPEMSKGVLVGSRFVFTANTSAAGRELWATDGTVAGTSMISDLAPGPGSSAPSGFVQMNGKALFAALRADSTVALYETDGTSGGTVAAVSLGHRPRAIFALSPSGPLLFDNVDDAHGRELWQSDGTPAGTQLLADINPGPLPSSPFDFAKVGSWVFFRADDGVHGIEPWVVSFDTVPPTISCPADLSTTAAGPTPVTLPAPTVSDDQTPHPKVTYSPASGSVFPLGTTQVGVTATDGPGNSSSCSFNVTVNFAPAPDAGTDGGTHSDGGLPVLTAPSAGCGCGQTDLGGALPLSVLFGLVLLGMRRGRANANRESPS